MAGEDLCASHRTLCLRLSRNPLNFPPHPQGVQSPEFSNFLFGVTTAHQLKCYIKCLAGIVPTLNAAAAVEVGTDADMLYADQLDGMIDMIHEVFNSDRPFVV